MGYTIGYEKQYEEFKNRGSDFKNITFNDYGYKASKWNSRWKNFDYIPKDNNEKFLLTEEATTDNEYIAETIIATYDTFEEAYNAADDFKKNLYINIYCVNLIFSNKDIKYRPSVILTNRYHRVALDNYSYGGVEIDETIVNKDNFNYEFFNKIYPRCKILIYKSIEDKTIKENMIKNILENIDIKDTKNTKETCSELLYNGLVDPSLLFSYIYKKDVPLKKQYILINDCFEVNRYVCGKNNSDSLIENEKTRDILEECYMNTPMCFYKAKYIAKNYERLSKKYKIDIYGLLKNNVSYDEIAEIEHKLENNIIFYSISKCINMSDYNYIDSIDFLLYAINNARKKDFTKIILELLSTLIIEKIINYAYVGNDVYITKEANFQLVADAVVKELIKSKKNKVIFIKKAQKNNYNKNMLYKCILKSIYASSDIKIKKALVKIGVGGK